MMRSVAGLSALTLVLLSGLGEGLMTNRWKVSGELDAAVARLGRVPASFGDWTSLETGMDRKALEIGEIAGYVSRRYVSRRDGRQITILVVCGRPGPIAVHTPDICYGGAGFAMLAAPVVDTIRAGEGGRSADFKFARFRRASAGLASTLRISWSWNADGAWKAADNPRLQFAPFPFLYKIYLIQEEGTSGKSKDGETREEFLRRFLPELDRALFPGPLR